MNIDHLAKRLVQPTSRRQALCASLAAALLGIFGVSRRVPSTLAKQRPVSSPVATPSTPTASATPVACAVGLTTCSGECVDLASDLNHCGACGAVCQSGLVPVRCRAGVCERATCPVGIDYCGVIDGCRDLTTDPAHCGGCQHACASGICSGGACVRPRQ